MNNFNLETFLAITAIVIALIIFYRQNKADIQSRIENTNSNLRLAEEKHEENRLIKIKIYLENIQPKQKELLTKIKMLRNCYGNDAKNLHLRWVEDSNLKFDKHQSDHIFHGRAPKDYTFYTGIYEKFKEALPEVKNLFPNSYTLYFNFILTLDPILHHTAEEKPSFDGGIWVDKWFESIKMLDDFIESTYNVDSELKNVWKD